VVAITVKMALLRLAQFSQVGFRVSCDTEALKAARTNLLYRSKRYGFVCVTFKASFLLSNAHFTTKERKNIMVLDETVRITWN